MIHLNMVSISRSRSNSRSNTKNSERKANFIIIFCLCIKIYLKWEEVLNSEINLNVWASIKIKCK